jgi:hypothetical protein
MIHSANHQQHLSATTTPICVAASMVQTSFLPTALALGLEQMTISTSITCSGFDAAMGEDESLASSWQLVGRVGGGSANCTKYAILRSLDEESRIVWTTPRKEAQVGE